MPCCLSTAGPMFHFCAESSLTLEAAQSAQSDNGVSESESETHVTIPLSKYTVFPVFITRFLHSDEPDAQQ